MAAKKPQQGGQGGPKKRRRKKMRLTLKSRSIKKTDDYTDSIGWEKAGRTLEDQAASKITEPQFIKHQCSLCGSVMQTPKPKRSKYTITCPNCEHIDDFQ